MNENNLFINVWDYDSEKTHFQFFVGARGTGKTYSALRGLVVEKRHITDECNMFLLLRRTNKELEMLFDDERRGESDANPFRTINNDYGTNYGVFKIKDGLAGIYNREPGDDGKMRRVGLPIGYAGALSTIATMRGMNFDNVSFILYDEFIPEAHVKRIRNEHDALLNAYETVNHGRELTGHKSVKLWCLANSNDIYNPTFTGLGLVRDAERMARAGKEHKIMESRDCSLHIFKTREAYKEKKSETPLYKLTAGTKYQEMALDNKFSYNDFSDIAHRDLSGYVPIIAIDNGFLYRRKSSREFYFSYAPAKCRHYYTESETDKKRFMREIGSSLTDYATKHLIVYESYELKALLIDLLF